MQQLADIEESLTLFTEGIAGRYLHIKASEEFVSHLGLKLDLLGAGQTQDTIYLPDKLDAPSSGAYRFLVMEQIGQRECGTFRFRFERALQQVETLKNLYRPPKDLTPRTGDYYLLFNCFSHPSLASELFFLLEKARVIGHLLRHYPGLKRHIDHYFDHTGGITGPSEDPLENAKSYLQGHACDNHWNLIYEAIDELKQHRKSVYDSTYYLCELYELVASFYVVNDTQLFDEQEEQLGDWLNREQRLEEWEEDMDKMESALFSFDQFEGDEIEAELSENAGGSVREEDLDIKSLEEDRDQLKRRIDMERSSVQHAMGPDQSVSRSFRYDEWDYQNRTYLRHWCRVFEEPLIPKDEEEIDDLNQVIRDYRPLVQKQLEQIRPTGLQRVKRVQDGDELDLNAIIEARQDLRAGQSPDERFYSRKERMHRDVCAVFLVDLSASTDDPIEKSEPKPLTKEEQEMIDNLRDPWDAITADELIAEEPKRKIIDVQREAMVVMASALDALGDNYGIYGFSGYGKDCVELFVAKEPDDKFTNTTLRSIASMSPKRSTRMGPAIRHGITKLTQSGQAMKILIILSDGFPQDCDYGPERGNHDYGVEDTAKALEEAERKGIESFCITVDRSGHDYLKRMCPNGRYMIIEEMNDLPDQLTKIYTQLTNR